MEAGIRFTRYMYVRFNLDPDTGDMDVLIEFITNEGEKQEVTGSVVWEEGE